jgi:hypothetical protein
VVTHLVRVRVPAPDRHPGSGRLAAGPAVPGARPGRPLGGAPVTEPASVLFEGAHPDADWDGADPYDLDPYDLGRDGLDRGGLGGGAPQNDTVPIPTSPSLLLPQDD